jgi:hypothetical protein
MLFAIQVDVSAEGLLKNYGGELMILLLFILVVVSLLVLVPQLLKAHLRKVEMQHLERLKALEQGVVIPPVEEPAKAAGRTAVLVPIVAVISAATVTCFLVVYRSDLVFSVALSVWAVAGLVSLAAVTGGVALLGRLAQLHSEFESIEEEKETKESDSKA